MKLLTNSLARRLPTGVSKGFTLIELVITMAILTIIAGVAVPQFSNFSQKAEDSRRIADLVTMEKALESYKADHGEYPPAAQSGWSGDTTSYGGFGYDANGYVLGLVPDYLKELPRDPNASNPAAGRGYLYRSNGTDFKFLAWYTPNSFPTDHRFLDPVRPTYSYQVSSPGGAAW